MFTAIHKRKSALCLGSEALVQSKVVNPSESSDEYSMNCGMKKMGHPFEALASAGNLSCSKHEDTLAG